MERWVTAMVGSYGDECDVKVAIEKIDAYRAVRVMLQVKIVVAQWRNRHGSSL